MAGIQEIPGPARLSAREAAEAIRQGNLTASALMEACLERIAAREPDVRAWTFSGSGTSKSVGEQPRT